MSDIQVLYAAAKYIPSFHQTLDAVASEKIYLEMVQAPPLEKVTGFQLALMARQGPVYYALDGDRVVGWIDIFPEENPRFAHRGRLGMGILPSYRGQGIGSRLMSAALTHAKSFGLEKVELNVYSNNELAIALYRKFGFENEGLIRKYRKVDGKYFDSLAMAKFL